MIKTILGIAVMAVVTAAAIGSAEARSKVDPVWMRVDGQRGAGNAALQAQFAADRRYCLLFGTSNAMISCMAGRGYLLLDRPDADRLSDQIRYQRKLDQRR